MLSDINKTVSRVSYLRIHFWIQLFGKPKMVYLFLTSVCVMLVVHAVVPGDGKITTSDMVTTSKPLTCHAIDTYIIGENLRSALDCAIKCLSGLYSCVGYVFTTTSDDAVKCEVKVGAMVYRSGL